jgi:hypothetical protein
VFDVEKPQAPAATASRTIEHIWSISSGVASLRWLASSPSTQVRTAVWPTNAATLIAIPRRSIRSRYSGKVSKPQSGPSPGE